MTESTHTEPELRPTVKYDSNNSGGSWWLKDEHWKALEAAGWEVDWYANQKHAWTTPDAEGRWLGALASKAKRVGLSMGDAIREWEAITGENSAELGCSCCGTPHSFSGTDADGKHVYYSPEYPEVGASYGE